MMLLQPKNSGRIFPKLCFGEMSDEPFWALELEGY
jgi:hypothetical protein